MPSLSWQYWHAFIEGQLSRLGGIIGIISAADFVANPFLELINLCGSVDPEAGWETDRTGTIHLAINAISILIYSCD